MPKPRKKFAIPLNYPCPCGNGLTVAQCVHLDPVDYTFTKPVPSLIPPSPKSEYSHPRCYLRETKDCSTQISGEHYVSKSVLGQLGELVRITGAHWLDDGASLETTVGNLTAKILCKRHNESLSPLDAEAGLFFKALFTVFVDLKRRSLSRKPVFHLVSGEALELWMLKVACGLYFSVGSVNRKSVQSQREIDLTKAATAFFDRRWDAFGGLYARAPVGAKIKIAQNVRVAPLLNETRGRLVGAIVELAGLALELLFDSAGVTGTPSHLVFRPTELVWQRGHRRHAILLTWPKGTPPRSITFSAI